MELRRKIIRTCWECKKSHVWYVMGSADGVATVNDVYREWKTEKHTCDRCAQRRIRNRLPEEMQEEVQDDD